MRLTRPPFLAVVPVALLALVLVLTWPSLASLGSVADFFQRGEYKEARSALLAGGEGARPAEETLWRSRLATNVNEALSLLESERSKNDLPLPVQQRLALEMAEIYFARSDYRACLAVLEPVIGGASEDVPGEAYLLAGLTYRLVGQLQNAREMLASVRPSDPAFALARYYLGDIGLQQGDNSLALRYFDSGRSSSLATDHPSLQAGKWRALRESGQTQEAAAILARLEMESPGCLALLEINRLQRAEAEEMAARTETQAEPDSTATRPTDRNGRYSLQLGAFSDRALALEFLRRYETMLPDLRIDQVQDQRGQFLYKVRSGRYVNPALARTEAARVKRSLGIDVIVSDVNASN